MIKTLMIASRRFYLKQPAQLGLAIAGIGLGVAVVVGIDFANSAARRAFELSGEIAMGGATHQLVAPVGHIPESLYRDLRLGLGLKQVTPVVQGRLRIPAVSNRSFTLLGIDPLAGSTFQRGFAGRNSDEETNRIDLAAFIGRPGNIIVPAALATQLGVEQYDDITVTVHGKQQVLTVAGILQSRDDFLWADIATAQEVFGMIGRLNRIDLILDDVEAARLNAADLNGTTLVATNTNRATLDQMTRAFRINLSALSLLALVVGMFLIYATMSFAVVQRRGQMGTLRALGVTQSELLRATLLEALFLGVVATAVGLVLGWLLAQGLVNIVLRTMQDLYFTAQVSAVETDPLVFVKGALLGIGATVLAALAPAIDAARTPPGETMRRVGLERATRRRVGRAAWCALPVSLAAVLLLNFDSADYDLLLAFAGLFLVIVAAALLIPFLSLGWLTLIAKPAGRLFGVAGSLALRGSAASLSRTGVAVASLSVAVATVIGVGLMIGSFRDSLTSWLDVTLLADFYIGIDAPNDLAPENSFSKQRLQELAALPGVAGLSMGRYTRIKTASGELAVRAQQPGPRGWGLEIIAGDADQALEKLAAGTAVLISEPLALRLDLAPSQTITLPTGDGEQGFLIAGVFRDYQTDGGSVLFNLDTYREHWADERLSGVGVYIKEGHDANELQRALEDFTERTPATGVVANKRIREGSLAVFDRTFEITQVLRILAGLVAFLGILSALLALQLERIREASILRALGFTPRQIAKQSLVQTTVLGLTAGLFAIPLGIVLAALLVYVINQRAYGWSMSFSLFPGDLIGGVVLAVAAAFLAGIYPARRLSRGTVAQGLRYE